MPKPQSHKDLRLESYDQWLKLVIDQFATVTADGEYAEMIDTLMRNPAQSFCAQIDALFERLPRRVHVRRAHGQVYTRLATRYLDGEEWRLDNFITRTQNASEKPIAYSVQTTFAGETVEPIVFEWLAHKPEVLVYEVMHKRGFRQVMPIIATPEQQQMMIRRLFHDTLLAVAMYSRRTDEERAEADVMAHGFVLERLEQIRRRSLG